MKGRGAWYTGGHEDRNNWQPVTILRLTGSSALVVFDNGPGRRGRKRVRLVVKRLRLVAR